MPSDVNWDCYVYREHLISTNLDFLHSNVCWDYPLLVPYWLAVVDRDCDWTDESVAADAYPALVAANNWSVVESAMGTAEEYHHLALLVEVVLRLHLPLRQVQPEAADSVASYYD